MISWERDVRLPYGWHVRRNVVVVRRRNRRRKAPTATKERGSNSERSHPDEEGYL